MMGRIAGKSIGELIGEIHNPEVAVYQATEYREKPVEESMELITRDVKEYNARALKIKVGGLGFLCMMHFVSALPNALTYHEFKGFNTDVVYECKTSPLKSVNGVVKVPTGPGSGVEIDPEFIRKHQAITD